MIDAETHKFILDKPWFLYFFSPTCGYSRAFNPTWEEFHAKHKGEVNIASIDCTADASKLLCMEYNIMAYPTLKYIPVDRETPVMYQYD